MESALWHAAHLQDNDFHEFKISVKASDVFLAVAAYTQLAEVCDHPLHIGITEAGASDRYGEERDRPRQPALGRDRRHGAGVPLRRAGGGGPCRLGDAEVARAPAPRREDHLLPVLRAAGIRRHPDGGGAGGPAGAHRDADHLVHHRLRGERAGRGADDGPRPDRRRGGAAHGLRGGRQDHTVGGGRMVEHLVELVERRAAQIQAEEAAAKQEQAPAQARKSRTGPADIVRISNQKVLWTSGSYRREPLLALSEPHTEELVQRLQLLLYRRAVLDARDAHFASELVDRLPSGGPGTVLDAARWTRIEGLLGRPGDQPRPRLGRRRHGWRAIVRH